MNKSENNPFPNPEPERDLSANLTSLYFETSPYGNVDALVQHDERVVYFYLNGERFGTKACWVRNLQEGPYILNNEELHAGVPPMLPRTHCCDPAAQPIPAEESLSVIWFEEGNGAALLENGEIIAVIPPWSGLDGFHGYAVECASESPICCPLPDNENLTIRIRNAAEFWLDCGREESHPFAQLQPRLLNAFRQRFGSEEQYYSLDGGVFPPRAAVTFRHAGKKKTEWITLLTVGMALRPQPNVELQVEHPRFVRRVELAIQIPSDRESVLDPILKQISGLVAYPWNHWTWFGEGHTCQFESMAAVYSGQFQNVAFVADESIHKSEISLPTFRNDPINLLWLIPIDESQQKSIAKRETLVGKMAFQYPPITSCY